MNSSYIYLFIFGCAGFLLLCRLSSCGEQGLLCSCGVCACHCIGLSCEAQAAGMQASVAAARGLRVACPRLASTGSIVVVHEPSCPMVYGIQIREQTHVFYTGKWLFFNHWATREAPSYILETELVGIFDGLVMKVKKVSTKQNMKFRKTA